jgi:guanine deaminase
LLGKRSLLAHGIYLHEDERQLLASSGASLAHCPTSNLFLGSGLFSLRQARASGTDVALGTDVGAGTSFSMLMTMNEAYKVQQLLAEPLDPLDAWYLATLGGARVLALDHVIGSLQPGREADFLVLDLRATELLRFRLQHCHNLSEMLFVLMMLGDDRLVQETWILGERAWVRDGGKEKGGPIDG